MVYGQGSRIGDSSIVTCTWAKNRKNGVRLVLKDAEVEVSWSIERSLLSPSLGAAVCVSRAGGKIAQAHYSATVQGSILEEAWSDNPKSKVLGLSGAMRSVSSRLQFLGVWVRVMADVHFKYQFRLILVGDSTVGKSSLLRQFTEGRFLEYNDPTVGVDFHARVIDLEGKPIKLQLWDTAGQERFRSITRSYYRNAAGGLLVYDICNRESFLHVEEWLAEARQCAEPHSLEFVLVGHKTDQKQDRVVSVDEGAEFARRHGLGFIETSARSPSNVEEAFLMVAGRLYHMLQEGKIKLEDGWDGIKPGTEPERQPSALPQRDSTKPGDSSCCSWSDIKRERERGELVFRRFLAAFFSGSPLLPESAQQKKKKGRHVMQSIALFISHCTSVP